MLRSTLEEEDGSAILTLEGELSFETVHEARDALQSLVRTTAPSLTLDIGGIDRFDLAGVQLIFSLRHTLTDRALTVELGSLAPRMDKLFAFAGLPRDGLFQGA
jgi:anti-anti-sigma factor